MRFILALLACTACVSVLAAPIIVDSNFDYRQVIPNILGVGMTFNAAGDLFVYDTQHGVTLGGCLFRFPNAAALPYGQTLSFNYGFTCETSGSGGSTAGVGFSGSVATSTGRLYITAGWELDPLTGALLRQAWNPCGAQHGIAVSPVDGSIFFVNYGGRKIYKVANPDTNPNTQNTCGTPFANTNLFNSGIDGVTVGPDGTVYAAAYDSSELFIYAPNGTLIGRSYSGGAQGSGPDGISICTGDGVQFAITADSNSQKITRFNLSGPGGAPSYAASTLVRSTGGYNDWTAVDPKGCIWVSTTNGVGGIWRLSNADGTCMTCNQPQQQGCPNCADSQTFAYQGLPVETHTATSQGDCVSLKFQ